jgi:predicted GTPase
MRIVLLQKIIITNVMLIEQIKKYNSVSIVGMAKNTGKTTCLNYVLSKLKNENYKVAVTSIGVDGEEKDVLYNTLKPRITLHSGNVFITSERHFNEKKIDAKIISTSKQQTALGRLITAKALSTGQVVLSGPSDSDLMAEYIDKLKASDISLILVDGALNRMSLASPSVTDALVLCTGAACAIKLDQLIKKIKYQCELINIKKIGDQIESKIKGIDTGVWLINENEITKLSDTLFSTNINITPALQGNKIIYIAGALTDNFMKELIKNKKIDDMTIIIKDFSRIFVSQQNYYKFVRRGGNFNVKQSANLIAVCSNPTSPDGYNYEADELRSALEAELDIPVYDIMKTK